MPQTPISQLPSTSSTADQEVLVKVEGVSKKFCRSLKKSLWYGVCDIAGELSPFGRRDIAGDRRLKMVDRGPVEPAGDRSSEMVDRAQSSASHLPSSGAGSAPSSISQLPTSSPLLRPGEFWAVNDVSFELRRGECLGLIGHNGAGTQAAMVAARKTAAGSPKGATSGSEQVNTTLLKMLNGLIKPDSGKIESHGASVDQFFGRKRTVVSSRRSGGQRSEIRGQGAEVGTLVLRKTGASVGGW